jgi:16S rRNA (adenine1518-N6/adenine1519-N6)-dimethyltransferase
MGLGRRLQEQKWLVLEATGKQTRLLNFVGQQVTPTADTAAGKQLIISGRPTTIGKLMIEDYLQPKKSKGQHWLTDNDALESICNSAKLKPGEQVFEIGPGTGELTAKLLEHGAKVTALEYDPELIPALRSRFKNIGEDKLQLLEGDIRTYNFTDISRSDYKIVANIPFYLTANLMRRLTDDIASKPSTVVLLVQKEVAERVAAKPGAMSIIAVAAQFYYIVELGPVVKAELFIPPPKVDSQVLVMTYRKEPLYPDIDTGLFFRIVKAGFSQRRKTLLNTLSSGLRMSRNEVETLLQQVNIQPQTRAQSLNLDNWFDLYQAMY